MWRRSLPTIFVAVAVACGTWVARDYLPEANPNGRQSAENEPSAAAQNRPSNVLIPNDVNERAAHIDPGLNPQPQATPDFQPGNGGASAAPSLLATDSQAKPLQGSTSEPLEPVPDMATQTDLKVDLEPAKSAGRKVTAGPTRKKPAPTTVAAKPVKKVEKPVAPPKPAAQQKPIAKIQFPTTYLAKQNDSFWLIAKKHYQNPLYYRALYHHNRRNISKPDRLTSGSLVAIPSPQQLRAAYPSLCPSP